MISINQNANKISYKKRRDIVCVDRKSAPKVIEEGKNYAIVSQDGRSKEEIQETSLAKRQNEIDNNAEKWQKRYLKEGETIDSFISQEELKKIVCANEILLEKQEKEILQLKKDLKASERRTALSIDSMYDSLTKKMDSLRRELMKKIEAMTAMMFFAGKKSRYHHKETQQTEKKAPISPALSNAIQRVNADKAHLELVQQSIDNHLWRKRRS